MHVIPKAVYSLFTVFYVFILIMLIYCIIVWACSCKNDIAVFALLKKKCYHNYNCNETEP